MTATAKCGNCGTVAALDDEGTTCRTCGRGMIWLEPDFSDYADNGNCPYCGHGNIEGQSTDFADMAVSQEVHCTECGNAWTDRYHLTSIITEDGSIIDGGPARALQRDRRLAFPTAEQCLEMENALRMLRMSITRPNG